MMCVLGELFTRQIVGIARKKVSEDIVMSLNYATTYPNATTRYHTSGMILRVDSDSSISEKQSGGHSYHSNASGNKYWASYNTTTASPSLSPPPNVSLHEVISIMKNIMVSKADSEVRVCEYTGFHNALHNVRRNWVSTIPSTK